MEKRSISANAKVMFSLMAGLLIYGLVSVIVLLVVTF